jgi:fused signal recognition particle receptor
MALFNLFRKKKEENDVPEGPGGSENLVESDTKDIQDAISSEIKQEDAVKELVEEEEEDETVDSVNVTGSLQGSIREAVFEEISSNESVLEEAVAEEEDEKTDEIYMDTMQDDIQEAVATEVEKSEGKEKKGFFKRLVSGLTKTRNNIANGIDSIFSSFTKIDEEFYEELEEVLVMADIGINATTEILEKLRQKVKEEKNQGCGRMQADID